MGMHIRGQRLAAIAAGAIIFATFAPGCSGPRTAADPPSAEETAPPLPDTAGTLRAEAEPFYGGFAYGDHDGARLLAFSGLADPETVTEAICQSGRRLEVHFVGVQEASEHSDGRQTSRNFDHDGGALFQVVEGRARGDETCFLVGPSLLALGHPELPRSVQQPSCDSADSVRINRAKARLVASCRRLGRVGGDASVLSARFELQGDSALASLVLAEPDRVTFVDFPAENGTWRVDDQGEFHPEDFDVVFVIDAPGARAMALTWAGAEGESSSLEVAVDGAAAFENVVRAYRYWVAY